MKFITIGADPEFFVFDAKGKPYPATPFTKGSKDSPSLIKEGFYEQRDNLSFEGNIPPTYSKEEFIESITFLRQYFADKVAKFGYSLSPNGVEYFNKRFLESAEGLEFGCSKVISSWDSCFGRVNERPTPILIKNKYRVSGFHIHIGYDEPLFKNKLSTDILIGRLFDIFLTIPSHVIKPEPERIQSYGKFGMIRSKSYGVECRTLSSYFTQIEYLPWVWDQVMKIENFINISNEEDLKEVISKAWFIGSRIESIKGVFKNFIFSKFKDKAILELFNETNI